METHIPRVSHASKSARRSFVTHGVSVRAGWRLQGCWEDWPKFVIWKVERKWKAMRWAIVFEGEEEDEYRISDMMWADNDWIFRHDKQELSSW